MKKIFSALFICLLLFALVMVLVFWKGNKKVMLGDISLFLSGAVTKTVGEEFPVSVNINTDGNSVCAVKAYLSFPKDNLEIKSWDEYGTPVAI